MGRYCSDCGNWNSCSGFSRNQWNKGDGYSRCRDCVDGNYVGFQCHQCSRSFNTQNELNMHMQVHRPRSVSCPICGDTRFKSGANAVQHVESGYCSGCRGQNNARQQIYEFASRQNGMSRFMTERPQLTYGDWHNNYGNVPEFPYKCPDCSKSFRQLSQLLQHNDQKHGQMRMLGY